jgi:hypothetical protein
MNIEIKWRHNKKRHAICYTILQRKSVPEPCPETLNSCCEEEYDAEQFFVQ